MASKLTFWGVVGFMLAAIGAVVAVTSWPETTTEFDPAFGGGLEPSVSETGNEAAANFGLMLLGVGSTVLWVVVIAIGVYCGLRMHEERGQRSQLGSRRGSSRELSTAAAEQLNREAQQRIAQKRVAEKNEGA